MASRGRPAGSAAAGAEAAPAGPEPLRRLGEVLGGGRLLRLRAAGRPAHAYLLVGPSGSGRRTAALALGAALLCERPAAGGDACGKCPACRAVAAGTHPDLQELAGHRLEHAKALTRSAALRPAQGGRAVFILPDADDMTPEAAAALLKPIEEPAGQAVFILTAVSPDHVPETIVSRCQVVPLLPAPRADLVAWLTAQGIAAAEAEDLAEASGGRPGRALELARTDGWRARRDAARAFVADIAACSLADAVARAGAAAEATDLSDVLAALRDAAAQAAAAGDARGVAWASEGFTAAVEAAAAIDGHVGARLTWEILAMRLRRFARVRYNLPKL
jgi:DNA polymerase-3 subunit delta'